jgi:hypothetical protein
MHQRTGDQLARQQLCNRAEFTVPDVDQIRGHIMTSGFGRFSARLIPLKQLVSHGDAR